MFIPCGWWHTAKSLTPSVSIALDLLNGSNWKAFSDDVKFETQKAQPAKSYIVRFIFTRGRHFIGAGEK